MQEADGLVGWLASCMDEDEAEACDWRDSHSPQFPSLVDPASALALVAAHRAILELYSTAAESREIATDAWVMLREAVRHLAAAYADRDGYDPNWRPQ